MREGRDDGLASAEDSVTRRRRDLSVPSADGHRISRLLLPGPCMRPDQPRDQGVNKAHRGPIRLRPVFRVRSGAREKWPALGASRVQASEHPG